MSEAEINFLDTSLFKVDNKLRTKVCVKPIDRKIYTQQIRTSDSTKKVLPVARH